MQNDKLLLHRIRGSEWVLCNIDNIAVGCGMVGWKIMLAIERRNAILAKLKEDRKVVVSDLSELYNVTEETIRREFLIWGICSFIRSVPVLVLCL